jgi:hypothetical protein
MVAMPSCARFLGQKREKEDAIFCLIKDDIFFLLVCPSEPSTALILPLFCTIRLSLPVPYLSMLLSLFLFSSCNYEYCTVNGK